MAKMEKIMAKISTALLVLCVILLLGNMMLYWKRPLPGNPETVTAESPRMTPEVKAIRKALPSVVNLSSRKLYRVRDGFPLLFGEVRDNIISKDSLGSGIILDESGLVLTNAHVVHHAVDISATLYDGTIRKATLVAEDTKNDIALLLMTPGRKLVPIVPAVPGDLMLGETTIAVGNPYGLDGTVTTGVISGLNRSLTRNGTVLFSDLIQTDTPLFPGSSGGPLINLEGKMIGMNTGIRDSGIAFAVPLLRIENALARFLIPERMTLATLGIVFVMDSQRIIRTGSITPRSPAAEAGIRSGMVLSSFNGWNPDGDLLPLCFRMIRIAGFENVSLVLDGKKFVLTTGKIDPDDGIRMAEQRLKLGLLPPDSPVYRRMGIPEESGLLICEPPPDSELKRGDLLLAIGKTPVSTPADAAKAILFRCPSDTVSVTVLSGNGRGFSVRKNAVIRVY